MKSFLSTRVQVEKITVFANLILWSHRKDIQKICFNIHKNNGIEKHDYNKIISGFSEQAIKNIIRRFQDQKLLIFNRDTQKLQLSEKGKYCVHKGYAPVYEQGIYSFWIIRHELIGIQLLHFERQSNSNSSMNTTDLPHWFSEIENTNPYTSIIDQNRFSIEKCLTNSKNKKVSCYIEDAGTLKLSWNIDHKSNENELIVEGTLRINNKNAHIRHLPSLHCPINIQRLREAIPNWNEQNNQIQVSLQDTTIQIEYPETFTRSFTFNPFTFQNQDSYELELQDANIGPTTIQDGEQWAMKILQHKMRAKPHFFQLRTFDTEWNCITQNSPLENIPQISEQRFLQDPKTDTKLQFLFQAHHDISWRD